MRNGASVTVALVVLLVILIVTVTALESKTNGDHFTLNQTSEVFSPVDNMPHRVHLSHASPHQAANMLAEIKSRTIELLRHLRQKYLRGRAGERHPERVAAVQRLLALYNPDNLAENSPRDPEGDTSYTIDKGAIVALCLREKDPRRSGNPATYDFHDLDTMMFVTIHELGHIAVVVMDHPETFWRAFKFLLLEAAAAGILAPRRYGLGPVQYCGMTIDYNPYYDPGLQPL